MFSSLANGTYAVPSPATLRTITRRALTFRSTRMHRTADQLSGPNAAGSSRFAKSVACTIATSAGRPDPAQSIRHRRRRPPASFELHLVPWWVLMVPGGWLPCLQSVARGLVSSLVCRESSGGRLPSGIRFWRRTRLSRACKSCDRRSASATSFTASGLASRAVPIDPLALYQGRPHDDAAVPVTGV